ncbi:NACHT domain-containing NTPase [Erythrobacter sp. HKB08]|uniref:NACHT domain-containing protein n=1 Tax=Erythrobacter sp. HKB08 TaxID=2502843 RepID=UPI0010089B71|nr:NACHT domain-containing protein [Erythrobacter sp. HKB08]
MSEFDTNKFAAEVVVQATERAAAQVVDNKLVDAIRRLYHTLADAYSPFLEKTYRRVSTIRTFLRPTESIDLLQAYIPVKLTDREQDYSVEDLLDRIARGDSFVVSALAGRGKSVLMRYLALSMYHAPRGKIPLFLELRSINSLTSKEILPFLHSQYRGDSGVSYADFLRALEKGYFCLILDGFDEVSPPDRDHIEAQILSILDDFEACPLVVSGRSDDRFHSWEHAHVLHLKPMSYDQTRALIETAKYDEDVKRVFLRRLTPEFFEKHESFLDTPLLAIMLMLTFEEYAEIPHSLHEFYRNAFDTLVRRHDAMKSQFLRETHSGCTAEEFKRIFSSFCVFTYSKSAYAFHRDEAIEYLKRAIKQQDLEVDATKILDDLIESVCLLQEEGFEISFVHRSFQEYFCALFISNAPSGFVEKYLEEASLRIHDDVLPMLYGMNPERVEEEWAYDFVEDIIKKYPTNLRGRNEKFLRACYPRWSADVLSKSVIVVIRSETKLSRCLAILRRFYPKMFESPKGRLLPEVEEWQAAVVSALKNMESDGIAGLEGFSSHIDDSDSRPNEGKVFNFELPEECGEFFDALYVGDHTGVLRSINRIRIAQRKRREKGQEFLTSLFD